MAQLTPSPSLVLGSNPGPWVDVLLLQSHQSTFETYSVLSFPSKRINHHKLILAVGKSVTSWYPKVSISPEPPFIIRTLATF